MTRARFSRFACSVLAANLAVILWGAYVRASGSGAGCGSHWPLCNGEVLPRSPAMATIVELTHRLTSGIALLLVARLVVAARRSLPRGDRARAAAAWSAFFILTEALLGAGLVLLEHVADDKSIARGWWVGAHLVNTYLLVAALALTAWWSSPGAPAAGLVRDEGSVGMGARSGSRAAARLAVIASLLGMLLLGVSGAITALGDTLFPVATIEEGKALTFSPSAHAFVRLRVWHPVIAIAVGALVAWAAFNVIATRPSTLVRRVAIAAVAVVAGQMLLGVANVWWLAPIPLQIAHLLLADLAWIALVALAGSTLVGERSPGTA
ncbi:MAG: COX15/CtaA family protein [Alphaproteobacteria bacterium]